MKLFIRLIALFWALNFFSTFVPFADCAQNTHQLKSKTHATPSTRPDLQLQSEERVDHAFIHEVIFAVKQKNTDQLHDILMDISDPASPLYGQHWSWKDINTFTRDEVAESVVKAYLKTISDISIVKESLFGDYLTVQAPIHVWESMFATKFRVYHSTHPATRKVSKHIRASEYSLPVEIADYVEAVHRTVQFPMPIVSSRHQLQEDVIKEDEDEGKELQSAVRSSANIPGYVTPALLFSYYNIPNKVVAGSNLVNQAIFGALGQTMSPHDLQIFQTSMNVTVQGIAGNVGGHVNDTKCFVSPNDCIQASLDVQYITAMGQKIPTYYDYSTVKYQMDWVDWITEMANRTNHYHVISISYAGYERSVGEEALRAFTLQAQKLGIVGTTLLAASGDDGVAGWFPRYYGSSFCGYYAMFPASSPYVTTVGGTMGPENGYTEVACQPTGSIENGTITSGGGFSAFYAQPAWQVSHINEYFVKVQNTPQTPKSGYNRYGRGYPDISLLAYRYSIIVGGIIRYVSGTSASVFTGIVSSINAQRKAKGWPVLGWLNPALYANTSSSLIKKDITMGNNNCVAYGTVCCLEGFSATNGWDPVTGLGSIDYQQFANVFMGDAAANVTTYIDPTMRPTISFTPTKPPTIRPTMSPFVSPIFIFPTKQPTLRPSFNKSPTKQPTLRPNFTKSPTIVLTYVFPANQVINGISLDTYNLNPSLLFGRVFTQSIADCMTDISPSNILDLVVANAPASSSSSRRLLTRSTTSSSNSMSAITISYRVKSDQVGISIEELFVEVRNGAFNTRLQQNAVFASATMLQGCTSSYVTIGPTEMNASNDASSDHHSVLTAGMIVGIVFGSVLLLAIFLVFLRLRHQEQNITSRTTVNPPPAIELALENASALATVTADIIDTAEIVIAETALIDIVGTELLPYPFATEIIFIPSSSINSDRNNDMNVNVVRE